jgi:transcription elongation factor GreB
MIKKDNYMTPACHDRMLAELKQLAEEERPEILKVIQWAAGNGDRSENADYQYGRKRLREIDSRCRFLKKRLDAAAIVDPSTIDSDTVKFGATVTIADEEGNERTLSIVGVDEVDTAKNHLSWRSPFGKALMGKEVGDTVEVHAPQGTTEYEVICIDYKALN